MRLHASRFAFTAFVLASAAGAARAETKTFTRAAGPAWLYLDDRALPATGDAEARAGAAIRAAASSVASVALTATTRHAFGDGDTIVRFEQTHRGLPVIGRGAAARLTRPGRATLVAVDVEQDLPATISPRLAAHEAARAASAIASLGAEPGDAHLVIWPLRGGGSRLAWAVLPRVPTGIPSAPRIIVDAESGRILEARDMIRFAKAQVYAFNPLKTPALTLDTLAVETTGTTLTSPFLRSTNCIDNKTVRPVNLMGFKSSMHVCDLVQTATADASGNFVYEPADDAGSKEARSDSFSEVQMYYHAAKAYAFFRELQGVADAQVVSDKPLPVIANMQVPVGIMSGNLSQASDPNTPLSTFSNAFFSPAAGGLGDIFVQLYGMKSGGLWFGQGPQRDYAYDGDVVYHEFVHAVVDATLRLEAWHVDARGAIDSPGAMNEALADYFSSAITGDPDVGEYASRDLGGGNVIRMLANADKCPTNVIGEVHADSTLFSGALWQARMSLPEGDRRKFDAAIYKAMRLNPGRGDLGFEDLAKLFEATLSTDLPAGATALASAMKDRGVYPTCERIFEAKDGGVRPVDGALGGFAAPGAQTVPIGSDVVPGIMQVHAPIGGPKPEKVAVTITARKNRGGGAAGFGGGGTPFAPVALVKFGKPLTWALAAGSQANNDADATAEFDGASGSITAEAPVPDGATDVYVQIANKGDDDGTYDEVEITFVPAAAPRNPNPEDPAPEATTSDASESGCSAHGRGGSAMSAGLLVGAALALGAARRRRR